ncbi:8-amino-7-oxononanoate synthase [Epibacterium ulvae]|uniref:8-amino-7-oxononanoate synthase n=1 Tax=Epibacterium ulvae TaxID=1156985 RepID=UPI0024917649|nr:8-amino-7-oxononanoate synthase [Epibacterium ulvae]
MTELFARQDKILSALHTRGRYRSLMPRAGYDFASNDYLGLAESDALREAAASAIARGVPVGAGGSRLLRGNADEHVALENEAAAFFGTDAALFMGGGFNANLALFSTLPLQGDLVLYDALIHASTHDGMRLGRADVRSFAHNDANDAAAQIAQWRADGGTGQIWIAVEAVYSMDGDIAPLGHLNALALHHEACLIIDEAHATGVFGPNGRGVAHQIAAQSHVLSLHTCGKALGVSGALICGHRLLIDMLVNKARAFIYATAPSPLNAALVRAVLRLLKDTPGLQRRAYETVKHAHTEAARLCGLKSYETQILPVVLGEDKSALAVAAKMQERGYDIRPIRPPTVPRGTARLRLSITPNVSQDVITQMFTDLAYEMEQRT